jgi:hypothetical protein
VADDDKKDPKIEVMPPMRRTGGRDDALPEVTGPSAPLGSTYLGRIKWNATARLIAAYTKMVREMEGAQRALGDLDIAILERQGAKMMLADAERIHATAAMQREIAHLQAQHGREEARFKLEVQAHDLERRRRELLQEKQPVEPEKPWQKVASKLQDIMEAEREMRAWFAAVKAEEIRKAGGEDKLSDEQRKMLEDLEMQLADEMLKMRTGQG